MKRSILLLAVAGVMVLATAAMAASPVIKVRVVNVSALGEDYVMDDVGIKDAATISLAQNPGLFPPVESLVFKVGKNEVKYVPDVEVPAGSLDMSGSLEEGGVLEFISIPNIGEAGKIDVAIVGRDGNVTHIDDEVVIDYANRTITTFKPIAVKDGDVLLIFSKDFEDLYLDHEGRREVHRPPDRQGDGRDPTHGRNPNQRP